MLNYALLIEQLVDYHVFLGNFEANNFLMKIQLDADGIISLNDLIVCIQSSLGDLNVSKFKSFVKEKQKIADRKSKLDATRELARELHRQQQKANMAKQCSQRSLGSISNS